MKFIVAHCNIIRASWDTEQQKVNCRKMSQGNFECVKSLFWLQLLPLCPFTSIISSTPPSFPEWRAFWVASYICSCRTPPSSPLSDSNLIQTIIDATILEVLRVGYICLSFKNACIKIVKLDGGLLPSPLPSKLISLTP